MQVSTQPNRSSYFFVDNNFVDVDIVYDNDGNPAKLIYSFTVYGRLIQALIDGYDEIEVSITNGERFSLDYFKGTVTTTGVEKAIQEFVKSSRIDSENFDSAGNVYNKSVISIKEFLPDDIVSGVGNGNINAENYRDYLPFVENLVLTDKTGAIETNTVINQQDGFSQKSATIFEKYSVSPMRVANIPHPALMQPTDNLLATNADVYGYYEEFFRSGDMTNTILQTEVLRANFQKFKVVSEVIVDAIGTSTGGFGGLLIQKQEAFLRLELLDESIIVDEFERKFDNSSPYLNLLAVKPDDLEVTVNTFASAHSVEDTVNIENKTNNSININITSQQFDEETFEIFSSYKNNMLLGPGETGEYSNEPASLNSSTSRSYSIQAWKQIPGYQHVVNNVYTTISPISANTISESDHTFNMVIEPASVGGVKIIVSGFRSEVDTGLIYRTNKRTGTTNLVGKLTKKTPSLTDQNIDNDALHEYVMYYQSNDGFTDFGVSAVYSNPNFINMPTTFSVTNQSTSLNDSSESGKQIHKFKITENIDTTVARQLLDSVNSTGEANRYENELESVKTETSVITKYRISRYLETLGRLEYLGLYDADTTLKFEFDRANETYRYYIDQLIAEDANVSYETTVSRTDANGNEYKFRYKKWRDPANSGALPTNAEIADDNVELLWSTAPVASNQVIVFESGNLLGSITSLEGNYTQLSQTVSLKWEYTGNVDQLMNFFIMATINGVSAPIGAATTNALPGQGGDSIKLTYVHDLNGVSLNQNPSIMYEVVPVLTGNYIQESKQIQVPINISYPRKAIL